MAAVIRVPTAATSDTTTARPSATVAWGTSPRNGRTAADIATGAATAAAVTTSARIRVTSATNRREAFSNFVLDEGCELVVSPSWKMLSVTAFPTGHRCRRVSQR